MLASSLREEAQATVSNKPGHRGEREVSRKTIACGNAGCSGGPVVTTLVCFIHFAREAAGALGTRHSPRPLFQGEAKQFLQNSGASRREIAELYLNLECRHCEERPVRRSSTSDRVRRRSQSEGGRRKRRSNPLSPFLWLWIASRSLSSGAHSRDPLARNEGITSSNKLGTALRVEAHPLETRIGQMCCAKILRGRASGRGSISTDHSARSSTSFKVTVMMADRPSMSTRPKNCRPKHGARFSPCCALHPF